MIFEFDPAKSEKTLPERGFDFAFAAQVFNGRTETYVDDRVDYDEVRMVAIGKIDGKLHTAVYTDRGEVRRIISAHRASRQESRTWHTSE